MQHTIDFIKVFHRVEVHLIETTMTIEDLGREAEVEIPRKECSWLPNHVIQYESGVALSALDIIKEQRAIKECHFMAFTSEMLYGTDCDNYVFGSADYSGSGIFSNFLFGSPEENFRLVTSRMMKITAHEFGHICNIGHCGKHECNIGGYNLMPELDNRPFYYCSKDTAKLCFRKGVTLQQYYSDLLTYFLDFERKYNTDFFEKEIKHVIKKLTRLENTKIF